MEKKTLLLMAISVGIFLTFTIGAAILVFSPKNNPAPAVISYANPVPERTPPAPEPPPVSVDPVDLVRREGGVPGLQTPPDGTVISVPRPSTAAVPDATAPAAPVRTAPAPQPAASPQPTSPPAAPRPAAQAPTQPAPRPAAQPARPAAQTTRVYTDYWVQTGAFSTAVRAEGVKNELAGKGITSIVDNREVDGRTLFRVRVGPYTSQTEANYWLSLIKSINGFENSQIRQTQVRR
jgi:DedD protein